MKYLKGIFCVLLLSLLVQANSYANDNAQANQQEIKKIFSSFSGGVNAGTENNKTEEVKPAQASMPQTQNENNAAVQNNTTKDMKQEQADTPKKLSSTDENSAAQQPQETAAKTISSRELFKLYDSNEVSADEQFKGKEIIVEGEIDEIGKDFRGKMYVALEGDGLIIDIQCFFSDKHKDSLGKLQKGQFIKIKGRCDGKSLNIVLSDCEIVS